MLGFFNRINDEIELTITLRNKSEIALINAFREKSADLQIMRELAAGFRCRVEKLTKTSTTLSTDNQTALETAKKFIEIVDGIDKAHSFAYMLKYTETNYGNSNRKLVDTAIYLASFVDDDAKFMYHETKFKESLIQQLNALGFRIDEPKNDGHLTMTKNSM